MRDEQLRPGMAMIAEAAAGPLRQRLLGARRARRRRDWGTEREGPRRWSARERARYFDLMSYLALEGADALAEFEHAPILLGLDGRAYTLDHIAKQAAAAGRVYVDVEVSRWSPACSRRARR